MLEDILIVAGVVAVLLYFGSASAAPAVAVVPPAAPVPTATAILTGGAPVSAGYQIPPPATALQSIFSPFFSRNAASAAKLASTVSSPPIPVPPPAYSGGIGGTVGTGGVSLGSVLRPGVSAGTGTTSINPFGAFAQ
jgi:hypothetical protein